ncbi:hypothetical protein [Microvirga soli]|uniref:hypothetical protein n=1 Tax=Microvirga soli TaxID=1854496 RepID=UPI001AEE527D|nr:hypothetical protein [Microvirga soli]
MTEDEIEYVAQEMAKVGGVSWYPGRTSGGLLRNVCERYRDRARVAIAALDRVRTDPQAADVPVIEQSRESVASEGSDEAPNNKLEVGSIVVHRPPGDQRAIECQVTQIEGGCVYLVPCPRHDVGWVAIDSAVPVEAGKGRSVM